MKNKKFIFINLSIVLLRKIILLVIYFVFFKKDVNSDTNLFFILFDEFGFGSGLFLAPVNYLLLISGYINVYFIFFGYLLFLLIYLIKECKKENPNNIKLLIFTIIHVLLMALYIYSSYIRLIIK